MKKLYEKNEILFAVLWILAYCLVFAPIRGEFGYGHPVPLAGLVVFTAGILAFVKGCHLEERYGLVKWQGKASGYLFFIPMLILMTGNLWGGAAINYEGISQVYAACAMMLVGFVEEMIFRGFLFRAMLKKDPAPVAVIVCAATFGIGHIVNLLAGQADLDTVIQIFFAVAWGFIFTMVFYKSGSLLMCIIVHGLVDVASVFGNPNCSKTVEYIYVGTTILLAAVYCLYLMKKPAALKKE